MTKLSPKFGTWEVHWITVLSPLYWYDANVGYIITKPRLPQCMLFDIVIWWHDCFMPTAMTIIFRNIDWHAWLSNNTLLVLSLVKYIFLRYKCLLIHFGHNAYWFCLVQDRAGVPWHCLHPNNTFSKQIRTFETILMPFSRRHFQINGSDMFGNKPLSEPVTT